MPVSYPPQLPIITDVRYFGADPTGVRDSGPGLAAALANGAYVEAPYGTYKINSSLTIPANKILRFKRGCIINITESDGGSPFVLGNAATLLGDDDQIPINVLNGASIASVITNATKDGTQEYAWLRNFIITTNTGSVLSGAGIDFTALFVNSGIRNIVFNGNNNVNVANGIRIAGGASTGFGPVYLKDCWVTQCAGSNVLVTEHNPLAGPCTLWIDNLTSENQASGFHGLELTGFGGLSANVRGYHWEHGVAVGATTAGIYCNGVANTLFDGPEILCTNQVNKIGFLVSNSGANVRIMVNSLRNYNNLGAANGIILQDLTGLGYTVPGGPPALNWFGPMGGNAPVLYGSLVMAGDLRDGVQTLAYNASVTIDPRVGSVIKFPLNGNVTFNQPWSSGSFAGQRLKFILTHSNDATTRTITWDAVFKKAGGAFANTNTANAIDTITFEFDGTNWNEVSRAINLS